MPQQVDYSILQQAPMPVQPNSLGSLGNIVKIGALMDAERAQKEQAQADQVLAQISQQYAQDPEQAVPELRRRGFVKQAQALELHIADLKKKQFEARKVDLENQRLTGQIDGDRAERETKAMDANSPEKMLTFVAGATTPDEWENGKALMRYKFGSKADPIIATLGDFDPARAGFAGRTVMGPAAVADDARQAASNQATQTHQQNVLAETVRHNQAVEANQAATQRRLAATGGTTGTPSAGLSASDKALVSAVLKNPAMFKSLTPTVKSRIGAALAEGGFQFEQQGSGSSRGVTSGDAGRIAEFDTSLDDVKVLRDTLTATKSATGTGAKIGAMLPNAVTDLTGWGTTAKQRQAVIDRVKQVIGKALEGGVLRAEDEKKYEKILPTIGDTEAVAQEKINGLEKAIKLRRERFIESLSDAGYDTSRYDAKGGTQKPGAPTAEELIKKYGGGG